MQTRTLDFAQRRRSKKPFPSEVLLPRQDRGRKPRDPDEEEALTCIVAAKADLYRKSGKVEFIGPRERRFFIGRDKINEYLRRQGQTQPKE